MAAGRNDPQVLTLLLPLKPSLAREELPRAAHNFRKCADFESRWLDAQRKAGQLLTQVLCPHVVL